MPKSKVIKVEPIHTNTITIRICGDTDLILNKMNNISFRSLKDSTDKSKTKEFKDINPWEAVITSIHWRDGDPKEFSEETFKDALVNNAPCITTFGLKKACEEAIVRNNIDKYSTKFRNSVNFIAEGGLVPIKFTEHYLDEKAMSPQRGSAMRIKLNRFTGWEAEFKVQFIEGGEYSLEQIIQIIGIAGFGGGIGSGRTSGYGRFHIEQVTG